MGKPLRVLYYVANSHRFFGAQQSLFLLLRGMNRSLVEPLLVFPREGYGTARFRQLGMEAILVEPPASLRDYGRRLQRIGPVEQASLLLKDVLPYSLRLANVMHRRGIQLAHFNGIRALLTGAIAAKISRIPVVCHLRGDLFGWSSVYVHAMGLLSDSIILVSDHLRASLPPRYRTKCTTVHNGIDPVCERSERSRLELMTTLTPSLQLPEGGLLIVMVASLIPLKGAHHLIEAARLLREAAPSMFERIGIVFVGDPSDDSYADMLKQRVVQLQLASIRFAGWQENPLDWVRASDVVVLPSVQRERFILDGESREIGGGEGFPRSVLEAMAVGRPVVASRAGGTATQVEHGITGMLVEPSNPKEIADALLVLARDPGLRSKMGAASRRRVEERFSTVRMVDETVAVYQRLLNPRRGRRPQ